MGAGPRARVHACEVTVRLLRSFTIAFCLLAPLGAPRAQTSTWQPSPGHVQLPVWPGAVPDARPAAAPETATRRPNEHLVAGKPWTYIQNVTRPTFTVYTPRGKSTGAAVVVFPGGGYQILAIDLEGTEVCDWLTSIGITCVLLKYRVPALGTVVAAGLQLPHQPEAATGVAGCAAHDGTRAHARRRVAHRSAQDRRARILGGGTSRRGDQQLSIDARAYKVVDAADTVSARPDFAVAIYPGHLWVEGRPPLAFNPDLHVTRDTPPTFLLQAQTDSVDNVNQSLAYYVALKEAGVPTELHLYVNGGHAFGLRRTKDPITEWPRLVERWLNTIGVISR